MADTGLGTEQDAAKALVDALASAGKTAAKELAGDPKVIAAFKLGWLIAQAVAGDSDIGEQLAPVGETASDRLKAQGFQLKALMATIGIDPAAPAAGAPPPAKVQDIIDQLELGRPATDQAEDARSTLAAELYGADVHCLQAYRLAQILYDARKEDRAASLEQARAALDGLGKSLPPYAAAAVDASMNFWEKTTAQHPPDFKAQCETWRIVLSGDKAATDYLTPEAYLKAAERLGDGLNKAALSAIEQTLEVAIFALILLIAGIVWLASAPVHAAPTAGAVSTFLAGLGLTWKAIGGAVGKLVGEVEAPLWSLEIDTAVAYEITSNGIAQPECRRQHLLPVQKQSPHLRWQISQSAPAHRPPSN
jgi:hypothetical protein